MGESSRRALSIAQPGPLVEPQPEQKPSRHRIARWMLILAILHLVVGIVGVVVQVL